ncbi:MAG: hypothetical protein P857_782 [Candidatus Xenolissoclinum pacificiensis L6]|uniref:Transposase n=1 Tax=Candidatus Xenolissoclinum pacificiensis L6 TaxID=1401685 RepID=W2V2D9_9RICK|nr:MAG: hypothetical protein P857_782 [Candidatus Xenolissoclinum pacificiensis L6]
MIDSTIVRTHTCATGYGKEEEGLGRSKGGFTYANIICYASLILLPCNSQEI